MTKTEYIEKVKLWCKKEYLANQGRYMFDVVPTDQLWNELCNVYGKIFFIHPQDVIEANQWVEYIPSHDPENPHQAYIDGYLPFTQKFIDEVMA